MESVSTSSNEADEVKRLRDQIRNLELENNRLRLGSPSKKLKENNSVENDAHKDSQDLSLCEVLNDILQIKDDFSDEETWLYIPKKHSVVSVSDLSGISLLNWLYQDVDDNDYEFQVMRRTLVTKIGELQQGSRRNNIDTRTFTRPKKQMSRPGLRSMVESPLLACREQMPPLTESMTFSENIDDISMPVNIGSFTSERTIAHESTYLNDNFQRHEGRDLNTTFQQVENTRNIMFHKLEDTGFKNSKLRRSEEMRLNTIYQHESPRLNSTFSKILSEPHLNTSTELRVLSSSPRLTLGQQKMNSNPDALNLTFHKSESSTGLVKPRGLANTMMRKMIELNATFSTEDFDLPSDMNGTFCVPNARNGSGNKRAASCDSIDDDYSSTSDNSVNTNNRMLNAGDVQNIARMQEESLHQVMSTPRPNYQRDAVLGEDLPSPIYSHRADMNHGYQSDHSDHSSLAKSSRSSQLSSPTSSHHGSTNMLANENAKHGSKLELPKMKPLSAAASAVRSKSRPASGLRPPTARTNQGVAPSGLPRPTTNIPRPQSSRIPAPKTRKPVAESRLTNNKNNWMDGCY